jgi:hypothetical protein
MLPQVSADASERLAARSARPRLPPLAAWGVTACLIASCGPGPRDGGFDSANPASRLYAVDRSVREWRAARRGDARPEVPAATRIGLVECLGSDDPLLRMNAALALEEMTGETRGYRFDDPEVERQLAIERWSAWARDGSDVAAGKVSTR